ncbi:MAG: TolB family protein, partial [Gemmatimonadota bacterium]
SIATARQQNGRWQIVTIEVSTGAVRVVSPDDGISRYEPTWTPDGAALIVVSEASGTPQLERLALDGSTRPVTRFAGLTSQPEVSRDGTVWFLALHARGYDLRTLALDSAATGRTVVLADSLAPVAPRQRTADARPFPTSEVTSKPYGVGRLGATWLPNVNLSAEGQSQEGAVTVSDAVGRIGAVLQGGYGEPAVWRGGSLAVTWRGVRPSVTVAGFSTRHLPSRQKLEPSLTGAFDAEYRGVSLAGERAWLGTGGSLTVRSALSSGRLTSLALLAPPCIECLSIWAPIAESTRQLVAGQVSAVRTYTPKG